MPPKSRTHQKRPNKNISNSELETKVGKRDDSSEFKCEIDDICKTKYDRVDLCDLINHLRLKWNQNIVNNLLNVQNGNKSTHSLHKASRDVLIRNISSLSLYKNESPFDRRIICIEWHPKRPGTLAVASKGGDILVWNYGTLLDQQMIIRGKGAGGAVQSIKFHPEMQTKIFTASIDGTVAAWDLRDKTCTILLKTHYYDKWCTSLDVSSTGGHIIAGDNSGFLTMLSLDGQELWKLRLHKSKITHVEHNPKQPWLVTTSAIDRTVKLWDVRSITGKNSALSVLHHDLAVNSAYFSLTDATRLLTTDQHSQLRVYKGPLWQLERIIAHPHRQFQHLTPIKATWHPLEDIVVVGRYPDKKFPGHVPGELRTIDFIDAETGKYKYGLSKHGIGGIISLNHFNILGDTLASGMGFNILIWRPDYENENKLDLKPDKRKQKKSRFEDKQRKSKQ